MTRYLFIHGAGCTASVFAAQTAAFAGSHAVTLPGRGDRPGTPSAVAEFADAVTADLDRLRWTDTVLCGSSMGGAIALELALRGDARVRGVVLLGSGVRLRVAPALLERLQADFPAAARSLATLFFAHPTPSALEAATQALVEVGQAQTLRDFRACDAFDASERAAGLAVPLLAVTGERDALTPPKFAHWFADRVPGAAARILPDAGHLAMIERPAETNAELAAFLKRIGNR